MTPRQELLLKAIIKEFIDTATAVGSLQLPEKYSINASPATIRNEMAQLAREGYLEKLHSSSGRIPTNMGIKYYLKELIEELENIEFKLATEIREDLHQMRFNKINLIKAAVANLSKLTKNTSVALVDENVYYSGLFHLMNYTDFGDREKLKVIFDILEDYANMSQKLEEYNQDDHIKVLVGEETGFAGFERYAIAYTPIHLHGSSKGFLAVVGPNRMQYKTVIPALKTIANHIEDVIRGW